MFRTTLSTAAVTGLVALLSSSGTAARPSGLAITAAPKALELYTPDPYGDCVSYSYPPRDNAIAAGQFPPIWQPAEILANDADALAKYNSISGSIPNIAQHGDDITGNFASFTPTYPPSDPDCWWTYDKCTVPKIPGLQPDQVNTPEPNSLGYGFDDGPNCSHNAFYDYLTAQNQKATMFYIGSNVMDWPYEAQRALEDGHEICVHTWSHRYMTAMNDTQAFAELYYALKAIKLIIGITPTCWRPPYGDVDDRIRWIAKALGMRTIVWREDSNDWKVGTDNITSADVDANYQALITAQQTGQFSTAGTIMLTHEINNYTMQEAMNWYPQLKQAFTGGLVPCGVSLNITQPYAELNYLGPNYTEYISGHTGTLSNITVTTTTTTSGSPTSTSSSTPSASATSKKSASIRSISASIGGALTLAVFSAVLLVA